jgi:ribonuclease-3
MGLKKDNEALAWLGDALIRWVASEKEFSDEASTKDLHNRREKYVKKGTLTGLSVGYGLDKALILPGHQEIMGGRANVTNLHTVFEAVVGAIFKEKGYDQTKQFILDSFKSV